MINLPQKILRSSLLGIFLVVIFILIIYFPILNGPFKTVYDSDHIVGNILLRDTDNIVKILTGNVFRVEVPYRPLTLLSHMAEERAFGLIPYFYYLVNILLHAGCALMAYAIVVMLTKNRAVGFLSALVFAVHPAHWEAVSFLSGRATLLNTFFNLGALVTCMMYMRRLNGWWMCVSLLSFICALLSHDAYLSMITVFLFYFLCVTTDDQSKGVRWLAFLPYAVVSLIFTLVRHGVGGFRLPLVGDMAEVAIRLMGALRIVLIETGILVAPVSIHFHQTVGPLQEVRDPKAIAALLVLVTGVAILIIRRKKTQGFILFLMVWFLATLWLLMKDAFLVGAGNGSLPVDGTMSYMASIPLIALLVLGAQKLLSVVQRSRLLGTVMIGILVVAFSILTFRQNILSTDEIAILKDAQHHEPASAILEYDLGLTYGQQSSLGESQAHFQRAVQLDPNFISAYMGLGKVLYEQGKLLEAAKAYESIRKPGRYAAVLENNLRGIYSILAIDQETILSKNPRDINAYFSLGIFYDKLGDVDRAIAAYQQVIELDPNDQAGLTVLALKFQGLIYQRLGLTEKAQQNFARVH